MSTITEVLDQYVAELQDTPGQWVRWPTPLRYGTVRTYASGINRGRRPFPDRFPADEFEARNIGGALYVRYLVAATEEITR